VTVTVIGAGVVGLTCAVRLAEAGFPVRVISRHEPLATTSAVAAAVWFPYLAEPRDRVLAWAARSRAELARLAAEEPESGVVIRELVVATRDAASLQALPWWAADLPGARVTRQAGLPPRYAGATIAAVPVAESPRYLPWLAARAAAAGAELAVRPEGVATLAEAAAGSRLVVHCSGLAARELAGDGSVVPVRGQVAIVAAAVDRVLVDDDEPAAPVYVIPRSDGCVVGGTAEPGEWDTTPDLAVAALLLRRASALAPQLVAARLLAVRAGLRPSRPAVRLERADLADGTPVIHCYGHGGSGLTLSWGCADEVLGLVRDALG
jgi:D-amino-acid oxidase